MSRKKEEHEKEPNHERWLVSYADFITLLFAVFVVLYAMSQVDKARVAKVIASTNEAFGVAKSSSAPVFNVIDSTSPSLVPVPDTLPQKPAAPDSSKEQKKKLEPKTNEKDPIDEAFKTPVLAPIKDGKETKVEIKNIKADVQDFKEIKKKISDFLQDKGAEDKIDLTVDPRGLVISLKDTEFFESGKATVRSESRHLLDNISAAIGKYSNTIRIEGHTDNAPIQTPLFPSNWELSTARATNIVQYLIKTHALSPERLSAIGYGEYRPLADNSTLEGRKKNRRVDVVLLSSSGEQGEPAQTPQSEQQATQHDSPRPAPQLKH
jgi:chemotaxis protein MotB